MDHQLHAATFVKKTLRDDRLLRGDCAQHGASLQNVVNRLLRTRAIETALLLQPGNCFHHFRQIAGAWRRHHVWKAVADLLSQPGDVCGKLLRSRRSLTQPEGNCRRSAMCVFNNDAAGFTFYPPNPPGCIAQQDDVIAIAFHREIFVERSYNASFRLRDNCKRAVSGMAPPLVMAASRAPRRGRSFLFTRSW